MFKRKTLITSWLMLCVFASNPLEVRAIETLSKEAIAAIELAESKEDYDRRLGFLRLEALREPATLSFIKGYLYDTDPNNRASSVRAYTALEGARALPILVEKIKSDPNPAVRRSAMMGLEPFVEDLLEVRPDLLTMYIDAMQDRSTEVRMTAVDIVSRINKTEAHEAIRMRMKRESRPDVLRVLRIAIERIEPSDD